MNDEDIVEEEFDYTIDRKTENDFDEDDEEEYIEEDYKDDSFREDV